MATNLMEVGCVILENINYLILSSYLRPFCDKILTAIFILLSTWLLTSTSDLQPSTAIANQLPGHLVSTQIRTIGLNRFKFIEWTLFIICLCLLLYFMFRTRSIYFHNIYRLQMALGA